MIKSKSSKELESYAKYTGKQIIKIAVTGGPCGGKSDALRYIRLRLEKQGWKVLVVPETATELITGGVAPWTCKSNYDYHVIQMELHDYMEYEFLKAAVNMEEDRVVIICDRGQPDCAAYLKEYEFNSICYEHNWSNLHENYEAVFHLETIAKTYPDFYTLETNEARHESVQEAIELDDKLLEAWRLHPNRYVIHGEVYFGEKLYKFATAVERFLEDYEKSHPVENCMMKDFLKYKEDIF